MKRREFITLLAGAAAWPLVARAQQAERMRRIGVLTPFAANDAEGQARLTAFAQGLQHSGWIVGQNIRIEYRWGEGKADTMRKYAAELVALAPDVILANSSGAAAPLLQVTRTVPIVFTAVADPVGAGYVDSLARPGGNVAPSLGVELRPVDVRDRGEIERAITVFAQSSNGGLIVTGSPGAVFHRELIIALAARHRLPAVYNARFWAADGGLISYGPDFLDQHRRAAGYVDRILKGEKPADLPVQAPTKYELVINLKTAKAFGLEVPPTLLARADEVIE
jgi:ABC-type uncharacterized transport system substrate-binding protein